MSINHQNRLIKVIPYDPMWAVQFSQEAQKIKKVLGEDCIAIHHIGSTSVPGLPAKPIIDMLAVVGSITKVDKANKAMSALGYEAKGENGMPFRRYFQKGEDQKTHHLHIFETGNCEIERHLKFCDWLKNHPEDKEAYALLKQELAKQYPTDIYAYCSGKDEFIAAIDKKAGFNGLRIVKALTQRERNALRHFRQFYFFDKEGITDPYTWTFSHDEHVHFVMYQGIEIIGYAHLQLWSDQRAAMRILVIDEIKRNHQYGTQLLTLCERWLEEQGYKSLHIESSPEALRFYKNNNYLEMLFNDPKGDEGYPEDIAVGKLL